MDTWDAPASFSWCHTFQTNTSETHFRFRYLSSVAINLQHTPVMALNDLFNRDPVLTSTLQRANISYWGGEQVEPIHNSPPLFCSSDSVVSYDKLVLDTSKAPAFQRKWGGFCLSRHVSFIIGIANCGVAITAEMHKDTGRTGQLPTGRLRGQRCEASGSIRPSWRWECKMCFIARPVSMLPSFSTYFLHKYNVKKKKKSALFHYIPTVLPWQFAYEFVSCVLHRC